MHCFSLETMNRISGDLAIADTLDRFRPGTLREVKAELAQANTRDTEDGWADYADAVAYLIERAEGAAYDAGYLAYASDGYYYVEPIPVD